MEKSSHDGGNFQVCVFKTPEGLTIEAENKDKAAHYTFKVTNDVVPALTNQLFDDVDALYAGLMSALDNSNSDTKLSMIEDGKLEFSHKTKIGKTEKNFSFLIILEENRLDPMERMKGQIDQILLRQAGYERNQEEMRKKVKELEGRGEIQSKNEIKMLKTIEELASQVKKLEDTIVERQNQQKGSGDDKNSQGIFKPDLCFDPDCTNKDRFSFSNQNKTLVSTFDCAWSGALTLQALSPVGKQEFSVRIDTLSNYVAVGITSGKLKNLSRYYSSQGSCLFSCHNNRVYYNHNQLVPTDFWQIASIGSVITVTVDFDKNEITFCLNNSETFKKSVNPDFLKDDCLYPCVDLWTKNGVTFI